MICHRGHDEREVFADGNMSEVFKRGNSVFRARGPWSNASHQVLQHLEEQDFPRSPRLLGLDAQQEELGFMAGASIPASLAGFEDEALLVQVGSAIGELHAAMSGFTLEPGTAHIAMEHAPERPSIVCHNDIAPWNVIVSNGELVGLIDWDLVAPGIPEWELAYAAWRFAPLYPEGGTGFTPKQQARRITILLDAYGLPTARRKGFIEVIRQRMRSAVDTVESLGRQRITGFVQLYDNGLHLGGLDDKGCSYPRATRHYPYRKHDT